jgi:hypothetical protein
VDSGPWHAAGATRAAPGECARVEMTRL